MSQNKAFTGWIRVPTPRVRVLLLPITTLFILICWLGSAGAQPAGDEKTFERSPASGPPGTDIALSGKCLFQGQPTDNVSILLSNSRPNDQRETYGTTFKPGADGSFAGTLHVPDTARPDNYTLSATCSNGDASLAPVETTFVVTAGPSVAPPPATRAAPVARQPRHTG